MWIPKPLGTQSVVLVRTFNPTPTWQQSCPRRMPNKNSAWLLACVVQNTGEAPCPPGAGQQALRHPITGGAPAAAPPGSPEGVCHLKWGRRRQPFLSECRHDLPPPLWGWCLLLASQKVPPKRLDFRHPWHRKCLDGAPKNFWPRWWETSRHMHACMFPQEEFSCTIDPATARDLDDALSCEQLPDGSFRVCGAGGFAWRVHMEWSGHRLGCWQHLLQPKCAPPPYVKFLRRQPLTSTPAGRLRALYSPPHRSTPPSLVQPAP